MSRADAVASAFSAGHANASPVACAGAMVAATSKTAANVRRSMIDSHVVMQWFNSTHRAALAR